MVVLPLLCFTQTPTFNFHALSAEEGLTSNNIFNIQQHANGLIYVTTQNGIYQYDGYNFTKTKLNGVNNNVLQNSYLIDNEIFISIRNEGVATLNLETNKLNFKEGFKFKNNSDHFIITQNYAYVLLSGIKLSIINLATKKITTDSLLKAENRTFCIFKSKNNKVYAGKSNGLYDITNGVEEKITISKTNVPVYSICEKENGELILGSSNKLIIVKNNSLINEIIPKYTQASKTFLFGGEKSINKLVVDKYDRIWFTSYPDDNLYLQINNSTFNVFDILDIPSTLINCIYKDKNENIWVGTFTDGLFYIQNTPYNSYSFNLRSKPLNINQVLLHKNLLVAATNNGLYGLNINSNQSKILSKPDDVFPDPISGLKEVGNTIYYFKRSQFEMNSANFLADKEIIKFEPLITNIQYSIDNEKVIIADRFSNLLLTNTNATKIIDTLISFPNYRTSINAILKQNDTLFVGTNEGLYIYNFKTKKYNYSTKKFTNYKINDFKLISNQIYIAHDGGLTNYSADELIESLDNFQLNSIKKIEFNNNYVLLATQMGLLICNNKLKPIQLFDKTFGLQSNNINDISFSQNKVLISTSRGVAVVDTNIIYKTQAQIKAVKINNIVVNGEEINFNSSTIKLNPNQNDVSVFFISPYFNKPNKQYYRYKVNNGLWKNLDNAVCNLGNLEGGVSTIEIQTSLNKIIWSQPTTITFDKEKALSKANLLYIGIIIVGLLLIAFVSWVILKRIKINSLKRLQDEQKMNLLKHQAMNSLLSPHFIFNSLTSIQNYINTNNSLKASEYLAKFSRLIRMIIEKASQSEITLNDELTRLKYYLELEKERFKNKFDYEIKLDEKINIQEVKIPNMIIQPHVENCIIHGILPKLSHGNLLIEINQASANSLIIKIEDDGIGLIKAKEHAKTGHKSLGTSTIKNILEINSKITGLKQEVSMIDKSTLNQNQTGTIITIILSQ